MGAASQPLYAAIFKSTCFPADVINISRLDFSNLPRIKSDTRDRQMPCTLAASACVHSSSRILMRSSPISCERMDRMVAVSGEKPRLRNTLQQDLVILSFSSFTSRSPILSGYQNHCALHLWQWQRRFPIALALVGLARQHIARPSFEYFV